jgi:hypothetical protein
MLPNIDGLLTLTTLTHLDLYDNQLTAAENINFPHLTYVAERREAGARSESERGVKGWEREEERRVFYMILLYFIILMSYLLFIIYYYCNIPPIYLEI